MTHLVSGSFAVLWLFDKRYIIDKARSYEIWIINFLEWFAVINNECERLEFSSDSARNQEQAIQSIYFLVSGKNRLNLKDMIKSENKIYDTSWICTLFFKFAFLMQHFDICQYINILSSLIMKIYIYLISLGKYDNHFWNSVPYILWLWLQR